MTQGQGLYLLLVVGSFAIFMATLAYYAYRYKPRDRALPRAPTPEADAERAIAH